MTSSHDGVIDYDDATIGAAWALSINPIMLEFIREDLDKAHVGDDNAKVLLFLLAASSKIRGQEQSAIIQKQRSAGGSDLLNNVLSYFKDVIAYTRITGAAPDRSGEDFSGKILKVQELRGIDSAQPSLRVLLSEGNLTLLTTVRDSKGNFKVQEIKTKGSPSFFTTTTASYIDPELQDRTWLLSVDESTEQTRAVVGHQFSKFDVVPKTWQPNEIIKVLLDSILGKGVPISHIIIPYRSELAAKFPCNNVSARRDSLKFASLIAVIAWLHQISRAYVKSEDGTLYLIASKRDLELALKYGASALTSTLLKMSSNTLKVLETLVKLANNAENPVKVKDVWNVVQDTLKISEDQVRRYLKELVRLGHTSEDRSSKVYQYSTKMTIEQFTTMREVPSLTLNEQEVDAAIDRTLEDLNKHHMTSLYLYTQDNLGEVNRDNLKMVITEPEILPEKLIDVWVEIQRQISVI